jgi:hypothetical protein
VNILDVNGEVIRLVNPDCYWTNCDECGFLPAFGRGDVNGDSKINVQDALVILRYIVGLPTLISESDEARGASIIVDLGARTSPNVRDALQILRRVVGLPNVLGRRGCYI